MTKRSLVLTSLIVLFGVVGFIAFPYTVEHPEVEAYVIGPSAFTSNPNITYHKGAWGDDVLDRIPFILISQELQLTDANKTQIGQWVDDGKAVLFFGEPVDREQAVLDLGSRVPVVPIEGNVENIPILYGAYGDIPLFLLSSEPVRNVSTRTQSFLYDVKEQLMAD